MALFQTLRMVFWVSAVPALIAVSGAGPRLVSGRPANGNRLADAAPTPRLQHYGRIPLSFEANQGQTDRQVQYLARGPGYTVFLTATEAVLALNRAGPVGDLAPAPVAFRSKKRTADATVSPPGESGALGERAVLRMQLLGSNPAAAAQGADRLPGIANYFLGNDASKWRTGIPTYAQVYYPEVYPGIGLIYYGNQRQLEYDFQVSPGADPSRIRLRFSGADRLTLDERGDLVVQAQWQILLQHKPVVYQDVAGQRHAVAATFSLERNQVGFALGGYDRSQALIIDPVLTYSTYLGGSGNGHSEGDSGGNIAVDASGSAYVTGVTTSPDFPTANALQPSLGNPGGNAFITKLTPDGSGLVYSTYLGGTGNGALLNQSGGDAGNRIAVDQYGNAYVTGYTSSADFPTLNAFQPTLGASGATNAFVATLTPDGSALVYSTYLGGSSFDDGFGIAVDQSGHVYVTGETNSHDFPILNAFQPRYGGSAGGPGDAFVTSLDAAGQPVYSTYLGGSGDEQGHGIAVDAAGNAYVSGITSSTHFPTLNAFRPKLAGSRNAFVTSFDPTGQLRYSTYLGGSGSDSGGGIAVDAAGNAYVTGLTSSSDFPTVNPLQPALGGPFNAFVAELSADGSALVYSTYLGGSGGNLGGDYGSGIAVDQNGQIFVTGSTFSPDFPTLNAIQPTLGGSGSQNAFVTSLSPGGALLFSTYLGGSFYDLGQGIAVDAAGNTYVSGVTYSADFPTLNAFQSVYGGHGNAFVAKISP
jgi:hypothetical protein